MYLTSLEMTLVQREALAWRDRGGVVGAHDLRMGWPRWEEGRAWEIPMTEIDRLMDPPSTVRCRTLRMTYDPDENLPWAFVPGDAAGVVWLVATRGPRLPKTS